MKRIVVVFTVGVCNTYLFRGLEAAVTPRSPYVITVYVHVNIYMRIRLY